LQVDCGRVSFLFMSIESPDSGLFIVHGNRENGQRAFSLYMTIESPGSELFIVHDDRKSGHRTCLGIQDLINYLS